MRFEWAEYQSLAKELSGQIGNLVISEEARLRTAISRAYYAAFNKSFEYLIAMDPALEVRRVRDAHYFVSETFERSSDKIRREIGNHLAWLRRHRNLADYDGFPQNYLSIAKDALSRANAVLHLLSRLK